MNNFLKSNFLYILGALIGAIAGYIYWQQIGCNSGTCMITSKPVNSTLYGSLMGALVFGIFKPSKKVIEKEDENEEPVA